MTTPTVPPPRVTFVIEGDPATFPDRPQPCPDCGVDDGIYFMVRDDVWSAAGLAYGDGWHCLGCLARRLGRAITFADFSITPTHAEYVSSWSGRSLP